MIGGRMGARWGVDIQWYNDREGVDANDHESGYYTMKYVCHQHHQHIHHTTHTLVTPNVSWNFSMTISQFWKPVDLFNPLSVQSIHIWHKKSPLSGISNTPLRDIDIDKQRQVQRMQNWKRAENKQKRTAWWFSCILCFAVLQKFLHNLAVKCCTLCNFWLGKPLSACHHLHLGIARLGGGSKPLPGWFGALF